MPTLHGSTTNSFLTRDLYPGPKSRYGFRRKLRIADSLWQSIAERLSRLGYASARLLKPYAILWRGTAHVQRTPCAVPASAANAKRKFSGRGAMASGTAIEYDH